jgi:hypothetical protein
MLKFVNWVRDNYVANGTQKGSLLNRNGATWDQSFNEVASVTFTDRASGPGGWASEHEVRFAPIVPLSVPTHIHVPNATHFFSLGRATMPGEKGDRRPQLSNMFCEFKCREIAAIEREEIRNKQADLTGVKVFSQWVSNQVRDLGEEVQRVGETMTMLHEAQHRKNKIEYVAFKQVMNAMEQALDNKTPWAQFREESPDAKKVEMEHMRLFPESFQEPHALFVGMGPEVSGVSGG